MAAAAAAAATLAQPMPANAQCGACSCSVSTNNLSFGTYNPTNASAVTANTNVNVSCFSLLVLMFGSLDISLSAGSSGTVTARKLVNGASTMDYNVYKDSTYSTVLGAGGAGGSLLSLNISGLLTFNTSQTVYGKIPAGQWVKPGTYTDNLVITISY